MNAATTLGAEVRLSGLGKRYGGTHAVEDIDLHVQTGEFLTLLGPSGSGKTTTLSMIAGFTEPTSGSVICDGRELTDVPPHKRGLGMVFQNYSLFPHMTVRENVEFPLRQRGVPKKERARQALDALRLVELQGRADAKPNQLSGGQQQRVALARALVFEPRLLLMDEPFGALDRALRERLQIELRRLHQELGITIIFVTHDQEEALTLSDRIAVFNDGKIEQVGTPEELYEQPSTLFVARFIGESNALYGQAIDHEFVSDGGIRMPIRQSFVGRSTVIVRPERVRVLDAGATALPECRVSGSVRDVTYLGSQRRVEVAVDDGVLIVRTGTDTPLPAVGTPIVLGWDAGHAACFPHHDNSGEMRNPWTATLAPST